MEGIGEKTIARLLREFGSLERVREASPEDLAKVVGPAAARRLREFYASRSSVEWEQGCKINKESRSL